MNLKFVLTCCISLLLSACGSLPSGTGAPSNLAIPKDLDPGDPYHVIFVTSTKTPAVEGSIKHYDAHVQAAAAAAGMGAIEWRAIVSTSDDVAWARIQALFGGGGTFGYKLPLNNNVPIYNQNGVRIANSFSDLWSGSILASVARDERNTPVPDEDIGGPDSPLSRVWTGTARNGDRHIRWIGLTYPNSGNALATDFRWITKQSRSNQRPFRIYAISEEVLCCGDK